MRDPLRPDFVAGQERFHALGPIYYRDADGALLVYDITDSDSFAKVKNWVKELKKMVGQDIVLCIAGEQNRWLAERSTGDKNAPRLTRPRAREQGGPGSRQAGQPGGGGGLRRVCGRLPLPHLGQARPWH